MLKVVTPFPVWVTMPEPEITPVMAIGVLLKKDTVALSVTLMLTALAPSRSTPPLTRVAPE